MAGFIIGLFYMTNYAIIAAFDVVQAGEVTLRSLVLLCHIEPTKYQLVKVI